MGAGRDAKLFQFLEGRVCVEDMLEGLCYSDQKKVLLRLLAGNRIKFIFNC